MIGDLIGEWIKGILIDGIMGNLSGLFNTVNTKVGEIASDVGSTPQDWNGGIFSMLQNLSETVIVPIAAAILALVMCYELIDMIVEKNNCNDSFHHYPAPMNVLREVHRVLKPGGTFLMGDCWQPLVGRIIMNFYMRHSKEGDVKIYSEAEIVSMLSKYFRNVSWEQIGNTACIAMGEK